MPRVTIADLVLDIDHLDSKLLESYLTTFIDNVRLLAAPFRPEQAETVTAAHLAAILKTMRTNFKYTIVDTTPAFTDTMLTVLDQSDTVLVISAMDLPTIKNVKLCMEIMGSLGYPPDKIKMVLNRASADSGMDIREAEESLNYNFTATLPTDGKTVVGAVNRGVPFVVSHPDTPVSQNIFNLAKTLAADDCRVQPETKGMVGKFKRLFG
jgi:pilus assembly protein CpaE